jgi:hypothetical protein
MATLDQAAAERLSEESSAAGDEYFHAWLFSLAFDVGLLPGA